jgi:hypothetical protein
VTKKKLLAARQALVDAGYDTEHVLLHTHAEGFAVWCSFGFTAPTVKDVLDVLDFASQVVPLGRPMKRGLTL